MRLDYPFFPRFYNCVNGVAYELPCAVSLVFDEVEGTCVRPEQASEYVKKCPENEEKGEFINIISVHDGHHIRSYTGL